MAPYSTDLYNVDERETDHKVVDKPHTQKRKKMPSAPVARYEIKAYLYFMPMNPIARMASIKNANRR